MIVIFALSNIKDDGWNDVFPETLYETMQDAILEVLPSIRNECVSLVDAFDLPDNVLNSTIGR